jgi:hypothetical protein
LRSRARARVTGFGGHVASMSERIGYTGLLKLAIFIAACCLPHVFYYHFDH